MHQYILDEVDPSRASLTNTCTNEKRKRYLRHLAARRFVYVLLSVPCIWILQWFRPDWVRPIPQNFEVLYFSIILLLRFIYSVAFPGLLQELPQPQILLNSNTPTVHNVSDRSQQMKDWIRANVAIDGFKLLLAIPKNFYYKLCEEKHAFVA